MIRSDFDEGVVVLTIERSEKANALTAAAKRDLARLIDEASSRQDVRGIVVTGSGNRYFCAGSDVAELAELDKPQMVEMLLDERALYLAALRCSKPVIAAVNGYAMGTGLILIIACDYAIAAAGAKLGVPEMSLGASTPLEGILLPWVVGLGWARAMFYGRRQLDAEQALGLGLIHEVLRDGGSCLDRAIQIARELSNAAGAFELQKRWMYRLVSSGDLDAVIQESLDSGAAQLTSAEVKDATRQFLSTRRGRV